MKSENKLDILLMQVGKAHSNKVNQILNKYHMHKGQPMMLHLLSMADGIPQSILAKEMVITPATVSAMVKRMEKAGFVMRKRDAEDERISNVYLTEKGRTINLQLHDLQNDMEELVCNGFSEKEKETMKNYMERVLVNLKK